MVEVGWNMDGGLVGLNIGLRDMVTDGGDALLLTYCPCMKIVESDCGSCYKFKAEFMDHCTSCRLR